MNSKPWETINGKIIITIIFTSVLILVCAGFIAQTKVDTAFVHFLERQEHQIELFGGGPGKMWAEIAKRHDYANIVTEFRETITRSIFLASLFGFSISVIMGTALSTQISKPLKKLKAAIKEVKNNNYKIKAQEIGSSEIRELIKEFNNLTSELERIEQLREELVSDVAHELKTPLTKVRGQIEGVIDGIYKSDKEQLSKTLENLDQLEYLIEKLQELSEISAGKIKLNKTKVKLSKLIEDIIEGYTGKNIDFLLKIDEGLTIKADKNRLHEILENIIGNAYKYTDSGKITISANKNHLLIKDTGPGIPEEDLPYIFERFYRVEKSRNKQTGGMGLGLAITKELVEAHDWDIKMKSSSKGTAVNIIFS